MSKTLNHYSSCRLCPRNCGVNRLAGEKGCCGETAGLRIGAAVVHKGEEPPLADSGGSGTIFISGCNLGCSFCQNYQISQDGMGRTVSTEEFVNICTALRDKGAQNINIVTGSHAAPALSEGLSALREAGVRIPVLWNSSGYDSLEALELLSGHIDIYLPDLKTLDRETALKFFNASDYPETAQAAILKMADITSGKIIVRHLILPGFLESTRAVLRWFADNVKDKALLSLMTQYTPIPGRNKEMPDRYLSEEEYNAALRMLEEFKIEEGFCQELVTGSDWLPDFKLPNPFPSELSVPVWHWTLPAES